MKLQRFNIHPAFLAYVSSHTKFGYEPLLLPSFRFSVGSSWYKPWLYVCIVNFNGTDKYHDSMLGLAPHPCPTKPTSAPNVCRFILNRGAFVNRCSKWSILRTVNEKVMASNKHIFRGLCTYLMQALASLSFCGEPNGKGRTGWCSKVGFALVAKSFRNKI